MKIRELFSFRGVVFRTKQNKVKLLVILENLFRNLKEEITEIKLKVILQEIFKEQSFICKITRVQIMRGAIGNGKFFI